MANFLSRRQFTTKKAQISVESGLPVGKHRFQVTAVHEDGTRSEPVDVVVNIVKPVLRNPILRETAEEPASDVRDGTKKTVSVGSNRKGFQEKTKEIKRIGRKHKP